MVRKRPYKKRVLKALKRRHNNVKYQKIMNSHIGFRLDLIGRTFSSYLPIDAETLKTLV